MWIIKLSVNYENGIFAPRAKKFNVGIHGYMLNYNSIKGDYYFTVLAFVEGDDKLKKDFVEDMKKDKRVVKVENQGDFFICRAKESKSKKIKKVISLFYNPLLIQVKPFVIFPSGWETLELASFERKHLEEIIKISEKDFNMKLEYIKEGHLDSMGILNVLPKLTEKQRNAVESATAEGYYEYPRKTDVKRLAKKNKLSFSTFQEHLRKAENKLIPFAMKKSN